jgi:hypothetical protein
LGHEIFYYDSLSKNEQPIKMPLCEKQKHSNMVDGEDKIHILFYGDNSLTVVLRQIKSGAVKYK